MFYPILSGYWAEPPKIALHWLYSTFFSCPVNFNDRAEKEFIGQKPPKSASTLSIPRFWLKMIGQTINSNKILVILKPSP